MLKILLRSLALSSSLLRNPTQLAIFGFHHLDLGLQSCLLLKLGFILVLEGVQNLLQVDQLFKLGLSLVLEGNDLLIFLLNLLFKLVVLLAEPVFLSL